MISNEACRSGSNSAASSNNNSDYYGFDYRSLLPTTTTTTSSMRLMGDSESGANNSINDDDDDCCSGAAGSSYFPALTWRERCIGCLTCVIAGYLLSLGSLWRLKDLVALGHPLPFVLNATMGNIISLTGSFFFSGPRARHSRACCCYCSWGRSTWPWRGTACRTCRLHTTPSRAMYRTFGLAIRPMTTSREKETLDSTLVLVSSSRKKPPCIYSMYFKSRCGVTSSSRRKH
jgi:Got1/Sft2-like family